MDSLSTKLTGALEATINRIRSQPPAKSKQAMEVLKWTFIAERQLSIPELRHALASINSTCDSLNLEDLPFEKSLTDCCYGLVINDRETSSIRLVHKSLQDFLQNQYEQKLLFETGHRDIAHTCLIYLGFRDSTIPDDTIEDSRTIWNLLDGRGLQTPEYFHSRGFSSHLINFPFLAYAVNFWGEHARKQIDQNISELAFRLLSDGGGSQCISQNLCLLALDVCQREMYSEETVQSHAQLGSIYRSTCCCTFWHCRGCYATYKPIKIDVNMQLLSNTPLIVAAQRGHGAVVSLLLENGASIHQQDRSYTTPLAFATLYGHPEVVNILLNSGANIDALDILEMTPLSLAAQRGHASTVHMLLERGADIHSPDKHRKKTPLFWRP